MMSDIKTREGFEFWDKLNALPRFAFFLSPSGSSVQKFEDKALGNWIDVHEAQKVVDQAQEEINQFRAERDALQLRLNAADQRIDELTRPATTVTGAVVGGDGSINTVTVQIIGDVPSKLWTMSEPVTLTHGHSTPL